MRSEAEQSSVASHASQSDATTFRGTREAPVESGIPPARERLSSERMVAEGGEDHIELALAESARTEANLNSLLRGLQHLAAGANAARAANDSLSHELDALRNLLGRSTAEEFALRKRVQLLERTVEATRRDASMDRAFFIEQEDAFLAELLGDHERELADLKRRLTQALTRDDSNRASGNSPTERTDTPAVDELAAAIGSLRLRTIRIPLPAHSDGTEEVLAPPRPSSRPPLKRKPDPSTRPLVGYSLGEGEVAEERVEGARLSTRLPNS